MNDELRAQFEQLFAIKDFPEMNREFNAVHAVKQCLHDFDSLPVSEGGKPILYTAKSDIALLYTLRQYLLGRLNSTVEQPLIDIELDRITWVASKYKEFCNKLPADLQLDLLKSLNPVMYEVRSAPMSHLVKVCLDSGYTSKQRISGFKFYLDDIGKPIQEVYTLKDIPYMHTEDFLCAGDLKTQKEVYGQMTNKFYLITRELLANESIYPTIRNTLFWMEGTREVAFVISEVDIHYEIDAIPLIHEAASHRAVTNYKDAFGWLNSYIFMAPTPNDKCRHFSSDLVNAFLFSELPDGENIYEISNFYSVGAMRQREVFYSDNDVADKVDVKEAFRLGFMSYFGGCHPLITPNSVDIISLMKG